MCLSVEVPCGKFNEVLAPSVLPFSSLRKDRYVLSYARFCLEAYMPTVANNIRDYLVSTYELCEEDG